jgi:hypothetical protein
MIDHNLVDGVVFSLFHTEAFSFRGWFVGLVIYQGAPIRNPDAAC